MGREPSEQPGAPRGLKRVGFLGFLVLGVPLLALILVEGASSVLLFAPDSFRAFRADASPEGGMQYDSMLGWVGRANLDVPDAFGPGADFRSNPQGFRGSRPTPSVPPAGKVRVVCSGDSFTQGAGVADRDTWCERLMTHPGIESVNLGVGGYGFDQAYLRSKRDGIPLQPDVQILAFIADDFRRMRSSRMGFAAKPVLALRGNSLEVGNVPVPRAGRRNPRIRSFFEAARRELRVVELGNALRIRLTGQAPWNTADDSTLRAIVSTAIADLAELSGTNGTTVLLLYLPTFEEYLARGADSWRDPIRAVADSYPNAWYLDLFSELRKLPPDSAQTFFIQKDDPHNGNAAGHYSARGNHWVGRILLEYLKRIPPVAARLDSL